MKGLFVTGTDTGVGKTAACAALMHRYRTLVPGLRYWKPIQTGIEQDDDTAEVRRLGDCSDAEIFDQGVRLKRPVSPHLAAKLAGTRIDLTALRERAPDDPDTRWIVEGAGGALVPVNDLHLMTDWMTMLGLPALICARSGLGTINHTLLTLEALRARWIKIAGVLMIGDPNPENRAAVERYGAVPVIGEMPRFSAPLTAQALGDWSREHLDRENRLRELFA